MYNPDTWNGKGRMPILYARTATGAINTWQCWLDGGHVVVEWGQQGGALQTSRFACEGKNLGRSNETTAPEQARLEAISKWKKQIKRKYRTEEDMLNTFQPRPMLALDFKKRKNIQYPVDVQTKFDGVRCLAYRKDGRVVLQSRGGDPYDVAHIRSNLEGILDSDTMLDGELYIHGMSLQKIISLVKRPQEQSIELEYCVYDIVRLSDQNATWEQRREYLYFWFEKTCGLDSCIWRVSCHQVHNLGELQLLHDEFVKTYYEGAIIRLLDGQYRFGFRSPSLLKYKAFDDDEFEILGWKTGRGKFEGVPIFRCVTKKGVEFDATPKGSDEERAALLKQADKLVGKKLTVRYFGFSDDGTPRFPVGVAVREAGI